MASGAAMMGAWRPRNLSQGGLVVEPQWRLYDSFSNHCQEVLPLERLGQPIWMVTGSEH